MNDVQRITLFGGSFDPVHQQHIAIAKAALQQFELDQLVFIPAKQSPFKSEPRASNTDRIAMLQLAITEAPRFSIDTQELERPAPSYTVDTVQNYRQQFPDAQLFLLIGSDQLKQLANWHQANALFQQVKLIVAPRIDYPTDHLPDNAQLLNITPEADASTTIRAQLKDLRDQKLPEAQITARLSTLLNSRVLAYIQEQHLYE